MFRFLARFLEPVAIDGKYSRVNKGMLERRKDF